jgi:CheY-like chemotaxis protein
MLGKRALVVDDSKSARVILRKMLEQYDLEVDTAESAEEAIDYLRHRRPDAIFMDHNMPGMDGLEAVRIIKDDPKTATIPIMMYTSREGEVYVGQARALGALGILPKQVEPAELFKILRRINLVPERRGTPLHTHSADDETAIESLPDLPLAVIDEIARIAVDTAEASHSTRHAQLKQLFEIQRERFQQDLEAVRRAVMEDLHLPLEGHAGPGGLARALRPGGGFRRWMALLGMAAVAMLVLIPTLWLSARYDAAQTALVDAQAQIVLLKQKEQIVDARQVQQWLATYNADHSPASRSALNNTASMGRR